MDDHYELAMERQRRYRDEAADWHAVQRSGIARRLGAAIARMTPRHRAQDRDRTRDDEHAAPATARARLTDAGRMTC